MDSMLRLSIQLLLVAIPLGIVVYGLNTWFALKRQHTLSNIYNQFQELPTELVPAVAGRLLNGCMVSHSELVATIFDLAKRGFIRIAKIRDKDHGFLHVSADDYLLVRTVKENAGHTDMADEAGVGSPTESTLTMSRITRDKPMSFEIDLMDFIFADIGNARQVKLSDIAEFSQRHPEKLSDFMRGWQQSVEMEADKHHFVDETKLKYASLSASTGYGMAGIGLAFVGFGYIAAVVPLLAGTGMVACKFSLKKSCCRGTHQFKQWKEFKSFLLNLKIFGSSIPTSMPIWEHYLSYAVAFEMSDEVMHQLNILIPAEDRSEYKGPAWYEYEGQTRGFEALKSIFVEVNSQFKNALAGKSK